MTWLLIIICSVFSILLTGLPLAAMHKELIIPYIKDQFAVACLQMPVKWTGYEFLIGLAYWIISVILIIRISKRASFKNFIALFYTTAGCLFFYLVAVVPKIEAYAQGPSVNFYKSLAGKNADAISVGFYSYAKFFYLQKPCSAIYKTELDEEDSLLYGKLKRPAYFVTKITDHDFADSHPDCMMIGKEGGYVFYERLPAKSF